MQNEMCPKRSLALLHLCVVSLTGTFCDVARLLLDLLRAHALARTRFVGKVDAFLGPSRGSIGTGHGAGRKVAPFSPLCKQI